MSELLYLVWIAGLELCVGMIPELYAMRLTRHVVCFDLRNAWFEFFDHAAFGDTAWHVCLNL